MALRPISFSIPSTTELKVTFTDELSPALSSRNFKVESLNGSVDDLEVLGLNIDGKTVVIKTRPQVSGSYYLLKFLDTDEIIFSSKKGDTIPFDSYSRELFFIGIDTINPFRDRMFENVPDLFELQNTNLKTILSAQAEEFYTAQKTIGEVLSNNYLSVDVVDEPRVRTAGATDRLANENAYEVIRVSRKQSGEDLQYEKIKYTSESDFKRTSVIPSYPISLQQVEVIDEVINIDSIGNNFDGFLLTLSRKNIIKILSVKYIASDAVEDCNGNIGIDYNIERYGYSIQDNYYDQDFAFKFPQIEDNQVLLSEFGNIPYPSVLDTFVVSYLYKNKGRYIDEEQVEVSRVENSLNESIPTNSTSFFLDHAPIVGLDNKVVTSNGVTFKLSENSDVVPAAFRTEIAYNSNSLPRNPGEYAINYENGEVFVVGEKIGEGTGRNNFFATYNYRKEFYINLDYSIYDQNIVAHPDRDLINYEAEIDIRFNEVFVEGVDYKAKTHIEIMPEFVENRLSQSFRIKTKNSKITDVFRILNQTTGEVYNPLFHTDTEVVFSGNRSPEVKFAESEEANFGRVVNEELSIVGEFIIPAFETTITSVASNNSIMFTPGIPAELISQNSEDYFFREVSGSTVKDVNIRFFGTPDSNNLITSAGISSTAAPPSQNSRVIIGTKGFIINLDKEQILNQNLDSIGNLANTSLSISDLDIFRREKYYLPLRSGVLPQDSGLGGLSKFFTLNKSDDFYKNLSRLRKVGDYTVDYKFGVIYVAVGKEQDYDLGSCSYFHGEVTSRYKNILTVSAASKKKNAPESLSEADIVYSRISNDVNTIFISDLEESMFVYDGVTLAPDSDRERRNICQVLDDYTVVVPYDINSIKAIYNISDLIGSDLTSSNPLNRLEEYSTDLLSLNVANGGRNLYDVASVSFEGNIIDLKKKKSRRVYTSGGSLSVEISDSTASTFVSAKHVSSGEIVFDEALNITKLGNLEVASSNLGVGEATVEIASGVDLSSLDTDNDYLLDVSGNRFKITAIDTVLSRITVESPAQNNVLALSPVVDPTASTKIVVKPVITIAGGKMLIEIPLDSGLASGDLLEITYLTDLIPAVGTQLAIDFRFGFVFVDYHYVADELVVWYEYGDNCLDWSIGSALGEGDEYYVTYRYGALREALRANFGSLTNMPFFQSFGVNTNRELYRDAIKGTLQSFPKGPTIPAFKELVKSFTKIEPNITELDFGNWVLGRDYLFPGEIQYSGVLNFAEGRFDDGLVFNDDVVVNIPSTSAISLDEGTLEAWVRPSWSGINNDAILTFNIDHIGVEKDFLFENSNPFDAENNWNTIPSDNLVGGSDHLGSGIMLFNYSSESSELYGLDQGFYGIYKYQENLDRFIKSDYSATMKLSMIGSHFNELRHPINEAPPILDPCEGDLFAETSFTVGRQGAGSFVEGSWPVTLSAPAVIYNAGSLFIPDGYRTSGLSLDLNEIDGFNFEIDPVIAPPGVVSMVSKEIETYDGPHKTRTCKCTISNTISNLENFNNLTIDVELAEEFSMVNFKSSNHIIDNKPGVFILVDNEGIFFEVVGFYNDDGTLNTKNIPDSFTKFVVKKFGINNPSLSTEGSKVINELLPSGLVRMLYKSVDVLTKYDYTDSVRAFGFTKYNVLDWSVYHDFKVERDPNNNIVNIYIDDYKTTMFYTDAFFSCNLNMYLNVNTEDLKGPMIGIFGFNVLSNLNILRANGSITNRYSLNDIYIGKDGFSPSRMPFGISREDYPRSTVGEPSQASSEEGIFIWFDENCSSPVEESIGQWVVRTRSDRNIAHPVSVSFIGNEYQTNYATILPSHKFSGVIITDGEFSSVSRAHREEGAGGCSLGTICSGSFRFCGNDLLEDNGWFKLEDSDSDLINVIVGGRETQSGRWNKHGEFSTTSSSGIYRMGPSTDGYSCEDSSELFGNLVYTEKPCSNDDFEYIVSLRVAQSDSSIVSGLLGQFSGVISGNLTGIIPIQIKDDSLNIKIALAYSSSSQPLVVALDAQSGQILDIISFVWNDQNFHEYRIERNISSGYLTIYIDNLAMSRILISEFEDPSFEFDFNKEMIGIYCFDNMLVSSEEYHASYSPNIIDIDLISYSGTETSGDLILEVNDVFVNTDSKIEFEFNIDDYDGYGTENYDAYDGYLDVFGVDEMFIVSDKRRYLVDSGEDESGNRFSIFKDGKGFLNFRIADASYYEGKEVGIYNVATNVKHFKAGELHHIAASWKLNSVEEKDEMHLFVDGQEAPSIYKFGGKVPVRLGDKFRDVSKEVLYDFVVDDIEFCNEFNDGTISAGLAIFKSNQANFTQDMIGRSIIFNSSDLAPTLVGKEYIIKSVIDSTQIILGRGDDLDVVVFQVSTSDINFSFPPTAGLISPVLTDIRNSKISIFRTASDGSVEEYSGIFYTVENGEVDVIRGMNVRNPKFRANLDTRIIEFVGRDSDCNYLATVFPTDIDVHIKTYGLNLENYRDKLKLSSSSFRSDPDIFSGQSVIRNRAKEPVSLEDVQITRVILDRTVVDIVDPVEVLNGYRVDFEIILDHSRGEHLLTSQSGLTYKQGLGRLLSLFFDSDNINFCEFTQNEDGYQDGYLDDQLNTITVYGTTADGVNEETFFIDKNGYIHGKKYFTSISRISGNLLVVDPDYFEAALISIKEKNPVSVSDNGGESCEVFDYRNGHLILTTVGSSGTYPFELHPGTYLIEYPTFLGIRLPRVGDRIFIGSDFKLSNQFGGVIDSFRVVSEISTDTRITEIYTSGIRSVTDSYNNPIPPCPDGETLTLIPFDNPIELQARRLRNTNILDEDTNESGPLSRVRQERLLGVVNDSSKFMSYLINWGISEEDALNIFYEVHRAEGGPLFNISNFYRNVEELPKSGSSVNSSFGNSGNFIRGNGLLIQNNNGQFRNNEGTIEFWVSPSIDTFVDRERRYYVDIFAAKREKITSKSSNIIELPNPASKIISVKLLNRTSEFSNLYTSSESEIILFDEISRSPISGVLEGGTGSDKDFSLSSRLSADGGKIFLSESLPGQNVDVVITYIPLSSGGDRVSIFKNEYNQLVFGITAEGIDNVVSIDIDWKKNTWHRVMCTYRTNSSFDTMKIFADGQEGGYIRYGTGLIYGEGYIYGQFIQGDGLLRSKEYSINLGDEFKVIGVGADIFGGNNSRSRIDNMRFSRIIRATTSDVNNNFIDLNYSANINTVLPVVEDDATTLLLDFDTEIKKINKFATIQDPKSGIYNFDIDVIDNFDKIIGINNGQAEDLLVQLVNRLKPAHTNALVRFLKTKC